MIRINTRMPDALWVDMKAQVASCRVAEKRIIELIKKYGVEKTRATVEDIHQYAERRMRREIEKLAPGTYTGESFLDSDGFSDNPIRIAVSIRIEGDEAWVDFEGSDPQVKGFVNSPIANTATCVYVAFLTTRDDAGHPAQRGSVPADPHHGARAERGQPGFPRSRRVVHPGHGLRHPRSLLDRPLQGAARARARRMEPLERPRRSRASIRDRATST